MIQSERPWILSGAGVGAGQPLHVNTALHIARMNEGSEAPNPSVNLEGISAASCTSGRKGVMAAIG